MKWWRGFESTSTSCWALNCCTSSRGRSMPRSWANTQTRRCPRCTALHTCCVCSVGKLILQAWCVCILNPAPAVKHSLSSSDSPYWSHAGLHSTGWEESGSAAQLPPRFPQVSFPRRRHHQRRDVMCVRFSYWCIDMSAARLEVHCPDVSHEIDFAPCLCGSILWQIDPRFALIVYRWCQILNDRFFIVLWVPEWGGRNI